MKFNYTNLKARIVEVFGSQKEFGKQLGVSEQTIYRKLNNKSHFRLSQIHKSVSLLNINPVDVEKYFFMHQ